jgi:vacuolar-type H+-ATPase subunit C/Vma6
VEAAVMRVAVESYAYIAVKLAATRRYVIPLKDLKKIEEIGTIGEFFETLQKYYPRLQYTPNTTSLTDFEQGLWQDYFQTAIRILNACQQDWQYTLLEYLLKFQIKNLETVILGKIADLDNNLIKSNIYWDAAAIFESAKLIETLLAQKSPRDILHILRNSRYGPNLEEGLSHFFNENNTFYFQAYLESYYYSNIINREFNLSEGEQEIIRKILKIEAEYYNIRIIYRALFLNFDPRSIASFLVPSNFILTREQLMSLINSNNPAEMAHKYIELYLKKGKKYKYLQENPVEKNFLYHLREFYTHLTLTPTISYEEPSDRTFGEIFRILIMKEYAIYRLRRTFARLVNKIEVKDEEIND